jgi:alpha-ribazole phosphatase
MTEIILIRHGETDYNKTERFMGWGDFSLNDNGRSQARNLGLYLADEKIEAVYSSDLSRCLETSSIIFPGISINKTAAFRELNIGDWEGLTYSEIQERYPEQSALWAKDWAAMRLPNGESFREMSERVIKELNKIKTVSKKTAIVTHGGCVRAILAHYLSVDMDQAFRFQVDNCTATRVRFTGDYMFLATFNEGRKS